jgi:ketoreductase
VPALRKNAGGGRIIFNASVAAKLPDPHGSAYNASKAGILGLMRCMAAELGPDGITVNTICPGWVDTPMARTLHEDMYDGDESGFADFYAESTSANMLGQQIKPEDIADAAVFLASDHARRITAQAYNVCAGLCVA